jgi:hypothetical protein
VVWLCVLSVCTCARVCGCLGRHVQGFCYRMRFAYAHFPINASIVGSGPGAVVEIRNFLGQRIVRKIKMLEGVHVVKSTDVKDQLELTGNDIELVSRSGQFPTRPFVSSLSLVSMGSHRPLTTHPPQFYGYDNARGDQVLAWL